MYFQNIFFHSWTFSERGIFVIGFSYPVVAKGKARIRVQISAAHTTEDIDRTVEAFIEVGRARNVIPWLIKKSENTKISNHLNVELKYNVTQLEQVLLYFTIIELNDDSSLIWFWRSVMINNLVILVKSIQYQKLARNALRYTY